ncbi:MAG TPA: sigma-70 family RNA polymerase sigma factor [Polyangiaceae bacterium]|jgi:RNA polymerase sigma-32 factor|nr:sigma-70 family RNA polymerase sigma factor [Polyangiaceae bacterium]
MARITDTWSSSSLAIAHSQPVISREREQALVRRWRDLGDASARDLLVRGHLRHVVVIARRFRRHKGATLEELIAEGNFGLVKALSKFDPDRGTRFVTYAVYWIRAYISQHLVRTKSLVSAGVQSKVLSKIRRARDEIVQAKGAGDDVNELISERLRISPRQLDSFLERMDVRDVPWDPATEDMPGGLSSDVDISFWTGAEEMLMSVQAGKLLSKAISLAVSELDEREQYIVRRRLMACREEELSLADIGRHFGISRERTRQLEARAMRKVKAALARSSLSVAFLVGRHAA